MRSTDFDLCFVSYTVLTRNLTQTTVMKTQVLTPRLLSLAGLTEQVRVWLKWRVSGGCWSARRGGAGAAQGFTAPLTRSVTENWCVSADILCVTSLVGTTVMKYWYIWLSAGKDGNQRGNFGLRLR